MISPRDAAATRSSISLLSLKVTGDGEKWLFSRAKMNAMLHFKTIVVYCSTEQQWAQYDEMANNGKNNWHENRLLFYFILRIDFETHSVA